MNRRRYERQEIEPIEIVFEKVEVSNGSSYDNLLLLIEEVSAEGIRFSTHIEFQLNELLDFHLPSLNIKSLLSGRIAWKKELKTEHYQYGLQI